jgi:hypothetical protein
MGESLADTQSVFTLSEFAVPEQSPHCCVTQFGLKKGSNQRSKVCARVYRHRLRALLDGLTRRCGSTEGRRGELYPWLYGAVPFYRLGVRLLRGAVYRIPSITLNLKTLE